jgi:hypothetical protein
MLLRGLYFVECHEGHWTVRWGNGRKGCFVSEIEALGAAIKQASRAGPCQVLVESPDHSFRSAWTNPGTTELVS